MGFAHHPAEPGTMFSSGHPAPGSGLPNPIGFMQSRDAGVTWEPISLQGEVDFHVMSVSAAEADVIYGLNASGAAGLYRSMDGGRTWDRPLAAELQGRNVFALAAGPEDANSLLAGTSDGLWQSNDGGESWKQLIVGPPVTAAAFTPGDAAAVVIYIADGQTGLVQIADLAGAPTSTRPLGLVLPPDDAVLHIALHPDQDRVMYAGSATASLFRTSDGGQTWDKIASEGERLSGETP
ncbi:MAG: hypothetical protein WD766_07650 [Gemmatimonadota bacterium]